MEYDSVNEKFPTTSFAWSFCAAISNVGSVKAVSDPLMNLKVMLYQVMYNNVHSEFPAALLSARPPPTQS